MPTTSLRLVNFEDHFVERKTVADLNDSLLLW